MSEKEEQGAPEGAAEEERAPIVADYTDSLDREEAHEEARERPEPKPRKEKGKAKDEDDARFRGILNETLAEREKRQKLEAELGQYKAWAAEQQRKIAAEADRDPAPDMFKDPKAYNAWVERQLDKRAKAIASQHVTPLKDQLSDYALRVSEMQAEKALGPERWNKLNDWIEKQDPRFKQWAMSQADPYAAAYQHYRQATTFERLGSDDIDTYEQKLREKLEAEYKAKLAAAQQTFDESDDEQDDAPPAKTPMPSSFAGRRSAGERSSSAPVGPKPLGEILKNKPTRQDKRQR